MALRYPVMKNGLYYGNLSEKRANLILACRDLNVVDNLTDMIFDFPPDLVLRSIEESKSIRKIITEESIDHRQYMGKLRDYQTVATAFMYLSPRSMLGDGVGLGKTAEVSALINYIKQLGEMDRFLIAVENSALGQIQCELMRFTGLYVVQMPSEQRLMKKVIENTYWPDVDGVIIKHSGLRSDLFSRWLSLYLNPDGSSKIFDTFILDESSVIKNSNTKIADYTNNICNIVPRVHYLNATSFETHIMDIYNQIDTMDPNILPKKWRIEKEYCRYGSRSYWKTEGGKPTIKHSWKIVGYKNESDFKRSLLLFYFGRSKKDVMEELPNQYMVLEVQPNNEQSLALAKGYRYQEVLNCPSLIEDLGMETNSKNVPKLERLISLVENEFDGSRIMIYCFHIQAQYAIEKELTDIGKKVAVINGSNTDQERWQTVSDFNKGKYDVLITNIKKSLNLSGGDVCIFYTIESNPSKMEQIRGRIDRNVDDKIKTFVLLVYQGTDEYKLLVEVVRQRAKDARNLTIDAKSAIDYFMESMGYGEEDD